MLQLNLYDDFPVSINHSKKEIEKKQTPLV